MLLAEREHVEAEIAGAIAALSYRQRQMVLESLRPDGTLDPRLWGQLAHEIDHVLLNRLAAIYALSAHRLSGSLDRLDRHFLGLRYTFDWVYLGQDEPVRFNPNLPLPAVHSQAGLIWARRYLNTLSPQLVETLRKRIEGAFAELDPTSEADVYNALLRIFTPERDETIAATETTRAQVAGERGAADRFNLLHPHDGIEARWHTQDDEKTCWICNPLHNQRESTFEVEFPSGPPAHPNCRCYLDWVPVSERTGRDDDTFTTDLGKAA